MKKLALFFLTITFGLSLLRAQDNYFPINNNEDTILFQEINDVSFITENSEAFFALSDEERAEKIDLWLTQNRKLLPKKKIAIIRETLLGLNETKFKNILMTADDEFKDPTLSIVLSLFLGGLGIDRFYVGDIGLGVLKLITFGGLGVWAIIDWFIIMKRTRNNNYKELMELCGQF